MAGLLFATAGGFLWMQQRYDTVTACLFLAVCFLLAALILSLIILLRNRMATRPVHVQPDATASIQGAFDPDLLFLAANTLRGPASKKAISLAALGVLAALAFLDSRKPKKANAAES